MPVVSCAEPSCIAGVGLPASPCTLANTPGSEIFRVPLPRKRSQSLSHNALGLPAGLISILRYSVSVERPGLTASGGQVAADGLALALGEPDAAAEADADVEADADALGL